MLWISEVFNKISFVFIIYYLKKDEENIFSSFVSIIWRRINYRYVLVLLAIQEQGLQFGIF